MRRTLTAAYCMFVFVCIVSVSAVPEGSAAADPVPGWEDAVMLEFLNAGFLDPGAPRIAADAYGNAFAVWDQYDGARNCVFASRYVHGVGWTGAVLIDSAGVDSCYNPRIAVDGSGNAIAVWQQMVSWVNSVWANRYVVGEGWGAAQEIEYLIVESGLPQVVVDESGNATVVWEVYDSGHNHIWSNRYVVGEGWGEEEEEEEVEQYVEDAYSIDLAVDDAGCVVAVWCQWDESHYNVSANRYVPGEGWGSAEMIGGKATGSASEPKVAVSSSGDATAVWYQFDLGDGLYSIWSNRYVAGEGWGAAELLEHDDSADASAPRVACDGSGNALAVWQQDDAGIASIWSSLYVPGEGWSPPGTVEDNDLYATVPMVVLDESGVGTAVWHQSDGFRNTICSSRYVPGEGWGVMELASTDSTGGSTNPDAALDGFGNVFAVWLQHDGYRYNVWANLYTCPDTTPPPISIESPADGLTTETMAITVSGMTEPGVSLKVNGMSAAVEEDGSFSCVVVLVDGANTITATATDLWGNSASASVGVTYFDPVADLEEQLAAALADLAALQGELDTALAEIAELQDDLDDANADVASLQAQLDTALLLIASMQAQLDDAESALADAQDLLDDAAESLGAAEDALADALEQLSAAEEELADAREELADAQDDADAAGSRSLLLMAALVVAAVAAVAMAFMYLRAKGKTGPDA